MKRGKCWGEGQEGRERRSTEARQDVSCHASTDSELSLLALAVFTLASFATLQDVDNASTLASMARSIAYAQNIGI